MKNPFAKKHDTGFWIATALTGALAAGAAVWFYLRGKKLAEDQAGLEHPQDYLELKHPKKKKHKTDVHDLADLVHHQQA
ncbi:hypothetical protein LX99_04178 [Mucilaginibacter oryzae]|uniref:Uncharacterized protein n=1 Tax=Mucilaginibacter oryzae TaxID=468058 RepID=A0A316H171_9SPHI|nr:hypothetical protein [Mucilaginibacter oryzae]PWK73792.1 hypothetical protein LX99_04178 [Mucilaginibacter oryzae]